MRTRRMPGKSRHKSKSRRIGRELRLWLPFLGFFCCYSLSATAIIVTELAAKGSRPIEIVEKETETDYLTISISSTSNASAAPGMMSGGAPRLP